MWRATLLLIAAAFSAACAGGTGAAAPSGSAVGPAAVDPPAPPPGAGSRAGPRASVVAVLTVEGSDTFRATGFYVAPDRVVTCLHAVSGSARAWVQLADGRQVPVIGVLAEDRAQDLVLLSVAPTTAAPAPLPVLPEAPAVGHPLQAIGCHRGRAPTATSVVVTRGEHPRPRLATAYHAQGGIGPGSSGCPLLDAEGRVRGVVVEEDPTARSTGLVVPARSVLALRAGALEPMDRFGARTGQDPEVHLRHSYERALRCLRAGDLEGARRGAERVYAEGRARRSLYSRAAVDVMCASLERSGRGGEAAARRRAMDAEMAADALPRRE